MSSKGFNVAVVGANSAVGAALLERLGDGELASVGTIHALADEQAVGSSVPFGNRELVLQDRTGFDFSQVQLAWFAAGTGGQAAEAVAAGCYAIDLDGAQPGAALVMPETLSAQALKRDQRLYALPLSLTTQLILALKPLIDVAGVERIGIVSFEAVSGEGSSAIEDLGRQTADLLNFRPVEPRLFGQQLAFNVIPQVGAMGDDGVTEGERRVTAELRHFLGEGVRINLTATRVPVFFGHSAAITLETREKLSADDARALLEKADGVELVDRREDGGFPTAVSDASGSDSVFVGRVREDRSHPRGLNLWVVSDNIRRGGALSGLRLAERLLAAAS